MASPTKNFLEKHARLLALGSTVLFLAQPSVKPVAEVWDAEGEVVEDDGLLIDGDGGDVILEDDEGNVLEEDTQAEWDAEQGEAPEPEAAVDLEKTRDAATKAVKGAAESAAKDAGNQLLKGNFAGAWGSVTSSAKKAVIGSASAAVKASGLAPIAKEPEEDELTAADDGSWEDGEVLEDGLDGSEAVEGDEAAVEEEVEETVEEEVEAAVEEEVTPESVTKNLRAAQSGLADRAGRDESLAKLQEIAMAPYWETEEYQAAATVTALYNALAAARTGMLPGGATGLVSSASAEQVGILADVVGHVLGQAHLANKFTAVQVDFLYQALADASRKASRELALPALADYTTIKDAAEQGAVAVQAVCQAKAQLFVKASYVAGVEALTALATWLKAPEVIGNLSRAGFFPLFDAATKLAKTQLGWTVGSTGWTGKEFYGALANYFKVLRSNKAASAKFSPETKEIVTKFYTEASKKSGETVAVSDEEKAALSIDDRLADIKARLGTKAQYEAAVGELASMVTEFGAKVKAGDAEAKKACAQIGSVMSEATKKVNLSNSSLAALKGAMAWSDKTLIAACQAMLKAAVDNKDFFAALPPAAQQGIQKTLSKASVKGGAVAEVTGFDAATIEQNLSDIATAIKANEAAYADAMANLLKIITTVPADQAKTYAPKVFSLLGVAKGKLAIRGVMNPLAYKKPATLVAYLECLQKFRLSGMFKALDAKSQTLVNTAIIDVQAKTKGDASDNSAFIQTSGDAAGTISDFNGMLDTTDRMLDNKAQYLAAIDNLKLMTKAGAKFAEKPTAEQAKKVGALIAKAKKKLAWTSTNFTDWSNKEFKTALAELCDAALKNWKVVFGVDLSAAQLTFLSDTSRNAKVATGAVVGGIEKVSVTSATGGLAGEGDLIQGLSSIQAGIKAAKNGTSYASAVDHLISFVKDIGRTSVSASVTKQIYDTVTMAKKKLAWGVGGITALSMDIMSAQGYSKFQELIMVVLPLYVKDMAKSKELNTWLTNAEQKRSKASDASMYPAPKKQAASTRDLTAVGGTIEAGVVDHFISDASDLTRRVASSGKDAASFSALVEEATALIAKRNTAAASSAKSAVTVEERNAFLSAFKGLATRTSTLIPGKTVFTEISPYEKFANLCNELAIFYKGDANLSKVTQYKSKATSAIATLKTQQKKAAEKAAMPAKSSFASKLTSKPATATAKPAVDTTAKAAAAA